MTAPTKRSRPRLRRTWGQRLMLGLNVLTVMACLVTAGTLWWIRGKDTIARQAVSGITDSKVPAQNWLVTGSDSRSCIDPKSPYAGGFLGDNVGGERSDTVMVVRIDPTTGFTGVLSFPRDLFVKIAGTSRRDKINSAFESNDLSRMVKTINNNFGVSINHTVSIDFCAFKDLVDVLGGVKVRFTVPTRDKHTGLNVPVPECHAMNGDETVAYARSRYYQVGKRNSSGRLVWQDDPSSDLGRISRQQQLIKIIARKAIEKGVRQPATLNALINAVIHNVKVDDTLSNGELLKLGRRFAQIDPSTMRTYTVRGVNDMNGDEFVLRLPTQGAEKRYNDTVLRVFQGNALPSDLQRVDDTAAPAADQTAAPATAAPTTAGTASSAVDIPTVDPYGFVPPDDPTCH